MIDVTCHNGDRNTAVGETFIVYAAAWTAFYDATMAACGKAGFTPRLAQEAPRVTSTLSLVASSWGFLGASSHAADDRRHR
jgi:hypothetical protein